MATYTWPGNLDRKRFYKFVGRPSDLEAFKYMREMAIAQREAALHTYSREPAHGNRDQWRLGFGMGVTTVVQKLMDAAENKQRGWGLEPVVPYKQAEGWFEQDNKVCHSGNRQGQFSAEGFEAGKRVSLNKGVSTQGGRKLIGGN